MILITIVWRGKSCQVCEERGRRAAAICTMRSDELATKASKWQRQTGFEHHSVRARSPSLSLASLVICCDILLSTRRQRATCC